ncbi:MAG: AAA family ATPase, partial [Tepidiformaceae bacterium]
KHEQQIRQLVKGLAEVEVRMFEADVEECVQRDANRTKPVGAKVIRDMYRQFLAPAGRAYAPGDGLPAAVLCDLDGTLALLNGRNPYDAATCEQDLLNPAVAGIIRALPADTCLVLVSGREDRHRPETERWLAAHGIAYDRLHMRATGDTRRDALIKEEIFEAHIRPNYRVHFVLDDRDQVVAMWRALGLTCLQVAEGDF